MKVNEFIERLKHIEANRVTYYDNSYPSNCGEINPDGSISFDCIGLIKSVINEPDIAYKTSPAGYYVTPGKVIPDYTEEGLLNLCTDIHYGQFGEMKPGAYMAMFPNPGHAGIYVGEFTDRFGVKCNTIECTTDWGHDGVIGTWTDENGRRYNHEGGTEMHPWEGWGYLSDYVDFSKEEPKKELVTVDDVVDAIIGGQFGDYPERVENLYRFFQDKVNERYKG